MANDGNLGMVTPLHCCVGVVLTLGMSLCAGLAQAADPVASEWNWSAALLRPFWRGEIVEGESVLFIKDTESGTARAQVLFPL
ncbi:MAG: hypothetical protein B7Z55_07515, partial [Planctomycetales bacterium 12-60-4]